MLKLNEARAADAVVHRRTQVLVIAEGTDSAERIPRLLADAGHEVSSTRDLSGALAAVAHGTIDLIVLHVGADRARGLEALRTLAQRAPVVALFEQGTVDDLMEATKRGAHSLLLGAWTHEALLGKVAAAAAHARKLEARSDDEQASAARTGPNGVVMQPFDWGEQLPSLREAREAFDRVYLEELMTRVGGNVAAAARVSGRNRTDLYDLLRRCHVNPADFRPRPQNAAAKATAAAAASAAQA